MLAFEKAQTFIVEHCLNSGAYMTNQPADDPTSSILRGIRVVVALAEMGTPVSFGALAEALQLPASTTHRILKTLRDAGYVSQDPVTSSYSVGSAFLRAATSFCAASTYPQAIQRTLANLLEETGQSTYYGAYFGELQRFKFVATLYSEHAVQYVPRKEKIYSVLWGASGRSIAAFLPPRMLRAIYDREKKSHEGNVGLPAWRTFEEEMALIRQNGYCITINHRFEGAHSVAAPVFGFNRQVIGCVGVSMPSIRREESMLGTYTESAVRAANELSAVAQCSIEQDWSNAV